MSSRAEGLGTSPDSGSPPSTMSQRVSWKGCIGREGKSTGDGRLIKKNALSWSGLPLPLRYTPVDTGMHDGAVVVGQIDTISREADGRLTATGTLDEGAPYGVEAARAVREELQNGVSMDLDEATFEIQVRSELLDVDMGEEPVDPSELLDSSEGVEGRTTIAQISSDDELMVITSARIRAVTLVSIPAFIDALIALADGQESGVRTDDAGNSLGCSCVEGEPGYDPECDCSGNGPGPEQSTPSEAPALALEASAAPDMPPAEWFVNPALRQATALTVTPEGRIYGHLAVWGTCHISHAHGGCVTPPRTASDYAYFHTGAVLTREGTEVPVGHITLDTTHAGERLSAAAAAAHYENTGSVIADVVAGEDAHGIWVAGAVRPTATDVQMRALRSSPLSGDWRRLSGNLELVAALAVVVPGFPVPRPRGLVAGGVAVSLVASGMLPPRKVRRPGTQGALSSEDLRYLKRLADRERAEELSAITDTVKVLARRVRASTLALRAHRPL